MTLQDGEKIKLNITNGAGRTIDVVGSIKAEGGKVTAVVPRGTSRGNSTREIEIGLEPHLIEHVLLPVEYQYTYGFREHKTVTVPWLFWT